MSLNRLHLFNELCILGLTYLVLGFSDATADNNAIYQLGYVYLGFMAMTVFCNIALLIFGVIRSIKSSLKKKKQKKANSDKKSKNQVD